MDMKQILHKIEITVQHLNVCISKKQFYDMPFLLGKLGGYSLILQEIVNSKLRESDKPLEG